MNRESQWVTRDVFSMVPNAGSAIWAGFLRVSIALLAIAGFATLVLLTVLFLEGKGLHSIVEIGAAIDTAINETDADSIDAQQYTGHLLSVVIISLSGLALLATFIGIAATLGLTSHARALEREIRDEIVSSSHRVFASMAYIETVFVQSQSSLDTAVYEWQSRSVWLDDDKEKRRAITRGYVAAASARKEVEAAQLRLTREQSSHVHVDAVQDHISHVRKSLDRLQANIRNTLAFYLASLESVGLLGESTLIDRGLLPERDVAKTDATVCISQAISAYDEEGLSDEHPMDRCQMEETSLFVHEKMNLESRELLFKRFCKLKTLVEKTRVKLRSKDEREALDRWWNDRKQDYTAFSDVESEGQKERPRP